MKKFISLSLAIVMFIFCLSFLFACNANDEKSKLPETNNQTGKIPNEDGENSDNSNEDNNHEDAIEHIHIWNQSTTTEATCNTNGERTFACECGASETETILMFGHSVENGTCIVCKKEESVGLEYSLSKDKTYYIVTGLGSCDDTDIIVPSLYNNLPVKIIGTRSFENCKNITSITISEGITEIYPYAFSGCPNLIFAKLPTTLELIYELGFNNCDSLISITIPEKTRLKSYAFDNCNSLESIYVSENHSSYISIDGVLYAIDYNYDWIDGVIQKTPTGYIRLMKYPEGRKNQTYELPNNAIYISEYALAGATNLKHINLHDDITYIGKNAFVACISLEEISIPDKVERIDGSDFYGCNNLKVVRFGKNVKLNEESEFDFNGCNSLERFEVNEDNLFFTVIDGNLYNKDASALLRYCSGKKAASFQIPNTVTQIGECAFMSADYLETIEIGAGVIQIGYYAFAYCEKLNCIKFSGTRNQWSSIELGGSLGGYNRNPDAEIICSDGNIKLD